jgi:hypothetical protein
MKPKSTPARRKLRQIETRPVKVIHLRPIDRAPLKPRASRSRFKNMAFLKTIATVTQYSS